MGMEQLSAADRSFLRSPQRGSRVAFPPLPERAVICVASDPLLKCGCRGFLCLRRSARGFVRNAFTGPSVLTVYAVLQDGGVE